MPKEPPALKRPALGRSARTLVAKAARSAMMRPAPPDTGAYGFPGSVALGEGRVFASSLDGKLYAFTP
jgi:hypothetical protein